MLIGMSGHEMVHVYMCSELYLFILLCFIYLPHGV